MTEYKHPNMFVENATLTELARWGEDHPDEWVRRMAYITFIVDESLPQGYNIEEWLENYADNLSIAEDEAEFQNSRADSAEADLKLANAKRDAALLDLEKSEQAKTVAYLKQRVYDAKQRVYDANHEIDDLKHALKVTRSNYDELQRSYKELEAKYNTWVIIAT